jgi:hypothetical protein
MECGSKKFSLMDPDNAWWLEEGKKISVFDIFIYIKPGFFRY